MALENKLLLIIIDGVPWRNWRSLFGNMEGWVQSGDAQRWKMRSALPSTSASCYASIHTGVSPQVHGVTGNDNVFRVSEPDIFSEVRKAGGVTGAVTHSYFSEFFNRSPFDNVRDIEYDEPESATINHGRFHTMSGYHKHNYMNPCDLDLYASLTNLCQRFGLDYGILHTCTLDSAGHMYGHENREMDHSCFIADEQIARFIPRWIADGYEVMVTADHGQSVRGHHGGHDDDMQDFALYYFGSGKGPDSDVRLDQLQLAPTILKRLGVTIPETMTAQNFLD